MKLHLITSLMLLFTFGANAQRQVTTEVQDSFKTPQYEVVYDDAFLSKKETKWLLKVDFLPAIEGLNDKQFSPTDRRFSIEFEHKLSRQLSLNVGTYSDGIKDNVIPASFAIEPRFYFNNNQKVNNLNGLYASATAEFGNNWQKLDPKNFYSTTTTYEKDKTKYGINVGIQKRVFNNWYFNYQLGVLRNESSYLNVKSEETQSKTFGINNRLSFGFAFGGGKKSAVESCDVFRCFEEEKSLLKIDVRGLFKKIDSEGFNSVINVAYERKVDDSPLSLVYEFRGDISNYKDNSGANYVEEYASNRLNFSIEPRFYYNLKKRIASGKSANNLSGFYVGLKLGFQLIHSDYTSIDKYQREISNNTIFGVLKWGLQKKIFRHGFFDISISPFDYINRFNVTDKRTKSENGVTKVEQFNYLGRAEFGVANVLPFFDFKMGFAF